MRKVLTALHKRAVSSGHRRCDMDFYLAAYGYGEHMLQLGAHARPIRRLSELLDHLPPLT